MSYYTELFTSITFHNKSFGSLYEVTEELGETKRMISYYENKLHTLGIMTEPKKFCQEEDPLAYVTQEVKESLEELQELYVEEYKLSLVIETWEKTHDEEGYAIGRPEGIDWDASFLDGDFITHREKEEEEK